MFPIGDQNRRSAPFPYVNLTLIALNALVFLYMLTLNQEELIAFVMNYGTIPALVTSGQRLGTLLTALFIHGGWLHILGNMIFLWVFGDNIEAALGHVTYAIFYLLAGVFASLAHILFNLNSTVPSIGASGAIAGVLGAYVILYPMREVRVLIFAVVARVSAVVFLGVWALLQLLNGLASLGVQTAETGGVAVWAHVGGFTIGALVGIVAHRAHRERRG